MTVIQGTEKYFQKIFIDNQFVIAKEGKNFDRKNPFTEESYGTFAISTDVDAERAIISAHNAFKTWRETTVAFRAELLFKLAAILTKNEEELAKIISFENGKTIIDSLWEVRGSAEILKWYAEETKRIKGEMFNPSVDRKLMVLHKPHGVVALISPWNFPLGLPCRSIGAILGSGCTVVLKPAPETPLIALKFADLAKEVGFPAGVINVITADTESTPIIGKMLCSHDLVRHITFTGSTIVGKKLMALGAQSVKRFTMELGGNAPAIVFESALVDDAIRKIMVAKFRYNGQTCISPNRIFVHSKIYEEFLTKFIGEVKKLKIGNPNDTDVTLTCLYDVKGCQKAREIVEEAKAAGAKIAYEGEFKKEMGRTYYPPTIIVDCNQKMNCSHSEVFSPVCLFYKFTEESEVFHDMNDVIHGLAAYVYSQDLRQINRVVEALEFGNVMVNDHTPENPLLPFTGHKQSGIGSELGIGAIYEYMDKQAVVLQL